MGLNYSVASFHFNPKQSLYRIYCKEVLLVTNFLFHLPWNVLMFSSFLKENFARYLLLTLGLKTVRPTVFISALWTPSYLLPSVCVVSDEKFTVLVGGPLWITSCSLSLLSQFFGWLLAIYYNVPWCGSLSSFCLDFIEPFGCVDSCLFSNFGSLWPLAL